MKKILLSIMFPAIALMAINPTATALPNIGPLTISWKVTQGPDYLENVTNKVTLIKKGTNVIGTNTVYSFKSTSQIKAFGNGDLLSLLAYSLSDASLTAKGNVLAVGSDNVVYVVNGTNIITNASPVLTVVVTNTVVSGVGTETVTVEKTGTNAATTNYSGTFGATQTSYVKVSYDDSSLITNGTASTFRFIGLTSTVFDSTVEASGAETYTENFNVANGAGTGALRGTNSILGGSVTGGPIKGIE
jgi:hypothetical protein